MDYDSSSKFISSLAKFLQSLCNGYVEFDSGVQVIGHLYLSVDTGKTIDYVLNEKVCKTDENSVTFISNSFHAQPAEKPKPPGKRSTKDSEKTDLKNEDDSDNINAQGEPRSTNVGTLPPVRNANRNSPHSLGAKRPFSPSHKSQSKTGKTSPHLQKNKKIRTESLDQNISQLSNPASENSISSAPSPAGDNGPSNAISGHSTDAPHGSQLNESYQQSYFHPDEESSLPDESEERDIKPSIDTDVTFIKEEYAPSSSCSQSGRDRSQCDETSQYSYQTNQVFPGNYSTQGGFGTSQRSNFNSSGSSHMFSPGQSSSKIEENSGDPTVLHLKYEEDTSTTVDSDHDVEELRDHITCLWCSQKFITREQFVTHTHRHHPGFKPVVCSLCWQAFTDYRHQLEHNCTAISYLPSNRTSAASSASRKTNFTGRAKNVHSISGVSFECRKCKKKFRQTCSLFRHRWKCEGTRSIPCSICGSVYYRRDHYKRHMLSVHGMP